MSDTLGGLVARDAAIKELPRGWDIGGGEGLVGKGCDGPLWVAGHGLVFTDVGLSRRLSFSEAEGVLLLHAGTDKAVGCALDERGGLLGCEFDTKRVTRLDPDGSVTIIADRIDGGPLAGPDDVAVAADGAIWFTDVREPFPVPAANAPPSAVYRVAPEGGEPQRMITKVEMPGGLAFSPDGKTLYVSDMWERRILEMDLASGEARTLCTMQGDAQTMPMGLAIDERGNVYAGGPGGIWVTAPDGEHLGVIAHPASSTTNLAFGGPDNRTLFFTTYVAVGYVTMQVAGAVLPGASAPPPQRWNERRELTVERRIEHADARMYAIVPADAEIKELASGGVFDDLGGGPHARYARSLEGTVWNAEGGYLFLSDIGNDRRLKWTPERGIEVLHPHTNHTNGATLDNDRAVVSCEHSARRVSRLSEQGEYTVVADRYDGRRLGRPNDVVVRSDGNIYFTCPWWDFGAGETSEQPYPTFYHVTPDGDVFQGPPGYVVPNGLAFTPDERVLYVNDSHGPEPIGPNIKAYDVAADGSVDLTSERVFFAFHGPGEGTPDGMKVDLAGNVYCGGPGGLWIISPDGEHLGKIVHGATQVNNIAFGDDDWKTLYFCSWSALFRIRLSSAGVPVPRGRVALS